MHALLGENGAGKSTLSNILTGLYRPGRGRDRSSTARRVAFHSPRDALDAGICMVHQHFRLVSPFTVAENVILGDHRGEGQKFARPPAAIERARRRARRSATASPSTRVRASGSSRVGEQQRVEILKALYREARILILDEPTAVLTPQEAESLFETLRAMAAEGRTVIFISHKLHEVKAVSDRVTVLRARTRSVATVDDRRRDAALARLADGRPRGRAPEAARAERREVGEAVLELEDVWAVGDRGGDGAARRLADGRRRRDRRRSPASPATASASSPRRSPGCGRRLAGTVRVAGRSRCAAATRARRSGAGVAHVPEDRLAHRRRAVSEHRVERRAQVLPRAAGHRAARCCACGAIRELAAAPDRAVRRARRRARAVPARQLSGGNLQKVVLAREFSGRAASCSSPPRRLAGSTSSAIETVHAYLRDAAADGGRRCC